MANWDDLKFFLALARHGSVRSAGASAGVSHSTVARRVGELEDSMGVRLFDRTAEGYAPTEAGEEMIEAAERIEEEIAGIERRVLGTDARLSGGIRVTMPNVVAEGLLMPDFVNFGRSYPEIHLDIETTNDFADLDRREADVAIRFVRIGKSPPEHLVGRRIACFHSAAYATREYLDNVALEDDPASARWIGWGDRGAFPGWVKLSAFPRTPARGRINDVMIQFHAARHGMGLAILPCFLGDPDPLLQRIGNNPPKQNFDIWLLSHPDLRETARLRVFRDFIANAIAAKRDLIEGRLPYTKEQ
jgi:DNA-binding transcriptional LysR family regulator